MSSGFPDAGFLDHVEGELEAFEPIEPREQVKSSWAPEAHARTCSVAAAQAIAAGLSDAELAILEHSGHMTFVEENDAYVAAVPRFLLSAG